MTHSSATRRRAWINLSLRRAVPAFLGLLIGVPLLFIGTEIPRAGVLGFAEADFLLFKTSNGFATGDLGARHLGVSRFASVVLPSGDRLAGEDLQLRIDDSGGEASSRTSIPAFEIDAGSRLSLKVDRNEQRLTVTVETKEVVLELIPQRGARVTIEGEGCRDRQCDFVFEGSRPLYLTANAGTPLEMQIDLDERSWTVADRVEVSRAQFWELEQFSDRVERRSGLKDGSLRFREAPDQAIPLERGTVVDFDSIDFVLRSVEIRGESVYAQFSGRVDDVSVEIGGEKSPLMPSWFDWLSRNPHVKLGLGIVSILLGGGLTLIESLAKRG